MKRLFFALNTQFFLNISPANAFDNPVFIIGVEGGRSSVHHQNQPGRHLAIRASSVELELQDSIAGLIVAKDWSCFYARFEHSPQDQRAVLGAGKSIKKIYGGFVGVEGGVLMGQSNDGLIGGGAEVSGLLTIGVIGLYLRESLIYTDSGSWQTDMGLRLNVPLSGLR